MELKAPAATAVIKEVSIPQAVSTIAMLVQKGQSGTAKTKKVSIPQAVSTIAIGDTGLAGDAALSFNTASGKYYCNLSLIVSPAV